MLPAFSPSAVELIGGLAALLTTVSFVPQVLHTWRSKSAEDLSIGMLATFTVGVLLWLLYGLALGSIPMIAGNALTLAQALLLIALRHRYGGRGGGPSDRLHGLAMDGD